MCFSVCAWVHLGADDSLGGSLYVGRQTKERRPVVLWEILYYAAVVLGRHTDTGHTQKCTYKESNGETMLYHVFSTQRRLSKKLKRTPFYLEFRCVLPDSLARQSRLLNVF